MTMKETMKLKKRSRTKLSVVEGNLKIGKGATIVAEKDTIVIQGKIKNKGGFKVRGNLQVREIESDRGSVTVYGDLDVERDAVIDKKLIIHGSVKAQRLSVGMTVKIRDNAEVEKITAGMKIVLNSSSKVDSLSAGMSVILKGKDNDIGKVSAGMSAKLFAVGKYESVSAGMKIKSVGGIIGSASAGMSMIVTGPVKIESASAGMSLKLKDTAEIGKASAGMSLKAAKDLTFEKISAGMSAKIKGNVVGEKVSVGMTMTGKEITVQGQISIGMKLKASKNITCDVLSVGKTIIGQYVTARKVNVAKRGRLRADVSADEVILGERAKARNIIALDLEMQEKSKAKNVYVERLIIEDGATITGTLEYTDAIDVESGAKIRKEPKKVAKLPEHKI